MNFGVIKKQQLFQVSIFAMFALLNVSFAADIPVNCGFPNISSKSVNFLTNLEKSLGYAKCRNLAGMPDLELSQLNVPVCNHVKVCTDSLREELPANSRPEREMAVGYLNSFFERDLNDLVNYDVMLRIAQEKDKTALSNNCYEGLEIPEKNNGCNIDLLNEALEKYSKSCEQGDTGSFCLNVLRKASDEGVLSLSSYKNANKTPSKNGGALDFLNASVESRKNAFLKNETEKMRKYLVEMKDKKVTTVEEATEWLIKYLAFEDPSASFLMINQEAEFKKDIALIVEKSIKKAKIFGSDSIDQDQFMTLFGDYKVTKTKEFASNEKACRKKIKMYSACYQATNIANGRNFRTTLESSSSKELAANYGGQLRFYKDATINGINEIAEKKKMSSEKIRKLFVNQIQCNSFVLQTPPTSENIEYEKESVQSRALASLNRNEGLNNDLFKTSNNLEMKEKVSALEPRENGENKINQMQKIAGNAGGFDYQASAPTPEAYSYNANKLAATRKENAVSNVEKEPTTKSQNDGINNSFSDDKIDSLANKLKDAEKKLAEIEASKKSGKATGINQEKTALENELVNELRDQIKNLKEEIKVSKKEPESHSDTNRFSSGNIENFQKANSERAQAPTIGTSQNSGASASRMESAASFGGGAGASSSVALLSSQAAAVGSAGDSRALTILQNKDAAILQVDGIGKDKIQDTIYSKIQELKGSTFYVEEEGVLKEVVVEYKDGKMVLDQYGKPVFKIVAIGKAQRRGVASRAKNAVSTQADLRKKQEEEINRQKQRAEYEKLRGLTRKVLKN